MRFLAFAILALPLLAAAQENDARLKKTVPFDDRYLTLSELGRRVAKEAEIEVVVEKPIAERKVAVFAADRSLGEVMARVADALFLEWVPENDGYRLRLLPKVAAEERSILEVETRLEREGLLEEIRNAIALSRSSLADYQEGYRRAKEEVDRSRGDQSPEGRRKSLELARALFKKWPARDDRETWDRGRVLGQMSNEQISSLLDGQPFFASANLHANFLRLSEDAYGGIRKSADGATSNVILTFAYRPGGKGIQWTYRSVGNPDGNTGITHFSQPLAQGGQDELENHPLVKRLRAWGKASDAALLKVPYRGGIEPPESHPTGLWSQSDALRWLHRQTGVPVIGDAFRIAAGYEDFRQSGTVGSFVKSITTHIYGYINPEPPYVRGDKGWLMLRQRHFWRPLQSEVPEGTLRPLEAKATALTLDDYANLVAPLTVVQADRMARNETFLVDFPTFALHSSIDSLRLWGTLPTGSKSAAMRNGLAIDTLTGSNLTAMRRYLFDVFLDGSPEELMPYMLPVGTPWPQGLLLQTRPTTKDDLFTGPAQVHVPRENEEWGDQAVPFTGWRFRITNRAQFNLTNIVFLHPKR